MKKLYNNISRVLCALLLCAGCIMFAGCTDDPLGDGENTEQGGNNGGGGLGESSDPVSVSLGNITATTVQFDMTLDIKAMSQYEEAGLIFSSVDDLDISAETATVFQINRESYSKVFTGLTYNTKYYYTTYLKKGTFYHYGERKEFTTPNVLLELSAGSITATTAQITGTVEGLSDSDKSLIEVGMFYSSEEGKVEKGQGTKLTSSEISSDNAVSFALSGLTLGSTYYYCSYVKQGDTYIYGDVKLFSINNISVSVTAIQSDIVVVSNPIAEFVGSVTGLSEEDKYDIEVGVAYCTTIEDLKTNSSKKVSVGLLDVNSAFVVSSEVLLLDSKYYYCSYVKQNNVYMYGNDVKEINTYHPYNYQSDLSVSSATDLSSSASANCYIVSNAGLYKFKTVKGNSSESVGNVASASILWETFGTSVAPVPADLIKAFCYKDGYIAFQTADVFKEGNAVIAAKDVSGTILWSWHIWLTDQPQGQVYYNNAGTMMDRNLGATSASPGDVGALGLLYQWGRKDPFLGSSSISSSTQAKSTITWPSAVSTSSSRGTVSYVTANPTTFVYASSSPYDWHYSSRDNSLWTTSESNKSIYDPCPAGWRVPDGGSNGVWSKALGSSSSFTNSSLYNSTNEGMNFSGKFGSASTIWYPASGFRYYSGGSLDYVGNYGNSWSASPYNSNAYYLYFNNGGSVYPSSSSYRASGQSLRCLQE